MFLILFFTIIILLLSYIKIKYFTLRGPIPGSPPYLLFGNLLELGRLRDDIALPQTLLRFRQRFGDIFQFWLGPTHAVVVGNVNDIQHIFNNRHIYDQGDVFVQQVSVLFPDGLISLKGAAHKRHAAVILPLFRRNKVLSNFQLLLDCTDKCLNNWRKKPVNKIHTDIVQQCQNLLLAIFGQIAFDYDLETLSDDGKENNNELTQELRYKMSIFRMIAFSPRFLSKIYTNLSRRYRRSQTIIDKYLERIVDKELNESPAAIAERKRTCLIASFVSSLQDDEKAQAMKSESDKKGLSRSEVFNETMTMLVAGYDSTSSALSWFIHLMSKHPEVQQKVKAELRESHVDHQLSLNQFDSLVYLDCVVKEVLRFAPPISGTMRTLTSDDCLPDSGVQLHKGETVLIPIHNLAYDPKHWSVDPERFYPERFLNEDKNHHPYAFLPFGGGHRSCVGQDLARFELKVIAARLMQCVTFGDGGPKVNAGIFTEAITKPKYVGVTIDFD